MKKLIAIFIIGFAVLALIRCKEDDVTEREYPRLRTESVSKITSEGALFNAQIIYRGDMEIKSYGFVWSEDELPDLIYADKVVFDNNIFSESFSAEISSNLVENQSYYVRSFIVTADFTVYGQQVTFVSLGSGAPIISSISPLMGTIGDTVNIAGSGFSYQNDRNEISFNQVTAPTIVSSDTLLKAVVPLGLTDDEIQISVSVLGNEAPFEEPYIITTPTISSIAPTALAIDDTLTIFGSEFSLINEANEISINGINSEVVESRKHELKAIVPAGLTTENSVQLGIAGKQAIASQQLTFIEPEFITLSPTTASFNETVTITGNHLSSKMENNRVMIGETEAEIISTSKTEVQFIIPEDLENWQNTVTYEAAGHSFEFNFLNLSQPVITSIAPDLITTYYNGEMEINGENFNSINNKNTVQIDGRWAQIVSASNNQIVIRFPRNQMMEENQSFIANVDIEVTVLDQPVILEDVLEMNYQSTWTKLGELPDIRREFALSYYFNGKAYIGLGGWSESYNDIWEYDLETDSWDQLPDFPNERIVNSSRGTDSNPNAFSHNDELYFYVNKEIWNLNLENRTWSKVTDPPEEGFINSDFTFFLNGEMYLAFDEEYYSECCQEYKLYKYNVDNDEWTRLNDLPSEFYNLSDVPYATTYNATGHVFTGYELMTYDVENDSWLRQFNNPGLYRRSFELSNEWYIGTEILKYNNSTDRWDRFSPPHSWSAWRFATTFASETHGYILFGEGNFENTIWRLDPEKIEF